MRGLFHAHMGWLFIHTQRGNKERFAPDLLKDPVISWVDRTFIYWAIVGLLLPFALGWLIGGTVFAGLTGLLWGGLVRVFVLHHFTYSINSLCHVFGKRDFETTDHSRNLALIAIPTLGEAFHNSHHAFPTSATHGLALVPGRHLGPGHRRSRRSTWSGTSSASRPSAWPPRPSTAHTRALSYTYASRFVGQSMPGSYRRRPQQLSDVRCGSAGTATSSPT